MKNNLYITRRLHSIDIRGGLVCATKSLDENGDRNVRVIWIYVVEWLLCVWEWGTAIER